MLTNFLNQVVAHLWWLKMTNFSMSTHFYLQAMMG